MERSIDSEVDELIACGTKSEEECSDQLVSEIHPSLFFRRNSVNCIIGKRSGGKTWMCLREILKCLMLGETDENIPPYTQLFYVSDKVQDDTVAKLQPLLEKYIQVIWIKTDEALKLFQVLELGKSEMNNPEFRKCLNAQDLPEGQLPHTILVFDDCIHLFSKPTELSKKLFQNRQSRISIFLILQDVNGLSSSVKSNLDSLVLFGGFSSQKYNVLTYQLPPVDYSYEDYSRLRTVDYVVFDFQSDTVFEKFRD